ncbi:MAG: hypothetical protein BGO12_19885 [Verrucomicrobia bacterium 61-8]|nr:MAG: hypothetical protein BGO12_19885 [Verrucomicrobia bacterium 61-8]
MKSLVKTLSILAVGGLAAGTAVAGPGDAHPSFAYQPFKKTESVQIALFRAGSGASTETKTMKTVPNANPKVHQARTVQVTGRMSPRY